MNRTLCEPTRPHKPSVAAWDVISGTVGGLLYIWDDASSVGLLFYE